MNAFGVSREKNRPDALAKEDSEQGMNLFTYGSLMHPLVWGRLVKRTLPREKAILRGYLRRQVIGEVYPAVIRGEAGSSVRGILYAGVGAAELAVIDAFEGGLYRRVVEEVEMEDGTLRQAFVYVIRDLHRRCLSHEDWDEERFFREAVHLFLERYGGFV